MGDIKKAIKTVEKGLVNEPKNWRLAKKCAQVLETVKKLFIQLALPSNAPNSPKH